MGFFTDAGNAVASAADFVGNTIQNGGNAIADTTEDVVDAINEGVENVADKIDQTLEGNPITPVVGGFIVGFFDMLREVVGGVSDLLRDVFDFVGALFKRDIVGLVEALLSFIAHAIALVVIVIRVVTLGHFVGAIVEQFYRSRLRIFVNRLITDTFDAATAARIRAKVGLTGSQPFGFPLPAHHRVMTLDSATLPDLARRHEDGEVDLYHLAGVTTDWGRMWEIWPRARTEGCLVDANGTESAVTRFHIGRFLESGGRSYRLRFYAMTPQAQQQHMRTSTRLHKQLGVRLLWRQPERFSWFAPVNRDPVDIIDWAEFKFDAAAADAPKWFVTRNIKQGGGDVCELVAVATFRLLYKDLSVFGVTIGLGSANPDDNTPAPPGTGSPGRDDRCARSVRRVAGEGAGIVYRDVWPSELFQYVLPHEIGHYVGLCHLGHDSIAYVMWTGEYAKARFAAGRQSLIDWRVLHFYFGSEPHFTFADAQNSWRYLLDQMADCVST